MTGKRTDKAANNDAPSGEASFLRLMKALLEFVMVRTGAHRGQGRDLQARIAATSDALDRLWAAPQLIDEFLAENPADFDERDLATIASWRTPVMGHFVVTGIQGKRFSCLPADAGTPPRLIMMHEGNVIFDVAGEEKRSLTVPDLLQKFEEVSGGELANDRMLLS